MLLYIYSGFNFVFSDYFFCFWLVSIFHYGTFFGSDTVALRLQEGFLLVFWLHFTFVLFRFFVSLVRLSFTRESAYSVWILTNYTDIYFCTCSVCRVMYLLGSSHASLLFIPVHCVHCRAFWRVIYTVLQCIAVQNNVF